MRQILLSSSEVISWVIGRGAFSVVMSRRRSVREVQLGTAQTLQLG